MELKFANLQQVGSAYDGSNRTFMELKLLQISHCKQHVRF